MEIKVVRNRLLSTRTIGQLYVNDAFFCFTLEDKVREVAGQPVDKWKVQNETAIPQGRYRITLVDSPKFGPDTLTVNSVPGFSFIRMHAGNTERDTEGCLILGYQLTDDPLIKPGSTRPAVNDLKQKARKALDAKEEVWITIINKEK